VSAASVARAQLAAFWARVTLICSCRPRELRVEQGHAICARCAARVTL